MNRGNIIVQSDRFKGFKMYLRRKNFGVESIS